MGQYHIAKEYQVYSMFQELLPMLAKCKTAEDKDRLEKIAFHNVILKASVDQRKFIRDIKKLMGSAVADSFLAEQDRIALRVNEQLAKITPESKADLDAFAEAQKILADDMLASIEHSLLRA
jgi:hypothetical protein